MLATFLMGLYGPCCPFYAQCQSAVDSACLFTGLQGCWEACAPGTPAPRKSYQKPAQRKPLSRGRLYSCSISRPRLIRRRQM